MDVAMVAERMAKRNDGPAKLNLDVLRKARIVVAYREIQLSEYLSEILRPVVERDLAAEQAKALGEAPPAQAPKRKGGAKA